MQVVSVPPQFHAALEAEPDCLTLRAAIADWFEENGQYDAAECMRWSIKHALNPVKVSIIGAWVWSPLGPMDEHPVFAHASGNYFFTRVISLSWTVEYAMERLLSAYCKWKASLTTSPLSEEVGAGELQ